MLIKLQPMMIVQTLRSHWGDIFCYRIVPLGWYFQNKIRISSENLWYHDDKTVINFSKGVLEILHQKYNSKSKYENCNWIITIGRSTINILSLGNHSIKGYFFEKGQPALSSWSHRFSEEILKKLCGHHVWYVSLPLSSLPSLPFSRV